MEGHFGIEFTVLALPDRTKQQLVEVRNMHIASGEAAFTMNDAVVMAVDALHKIEKMQKMMASGKQKPTQKTEATQESNDGQAPGAPEGK